MEALGIINRRWDAFGLQFFGHPIALRNANRVLRIDVGIAFGNFRNDAASPQLLRITRTDPSALFHFPLKMRPFGEQYSSLKRIESSVRAKPRMVMSLKSAVGRSEEHTSE